MASLQTLERRIVALEARLAEVEGGYGDTMYKLHRHSVKTDLRLTKVLNHLGSRTSPTTKLTRLSTRSR
jgi:hypothetical protein